MKNYLIQPTGRMNFRMQRIEEEIFSKAGQRREDFSVCLGCKICASVCTLNDVNFNVNPQEILLSLFFGKIPYANPLLVLCTSCYRCTESCPWKIRIPEIIRAIREVSGKKDLFSKAFLESVSFFGRAYEPYIFFRMLPFLIKRGYFDVFAALLGIKR